MPYITYIWTILIKITFSKSIIFKVKSIFIQISQKHYDNPNYYVSLVIFQTYKNIVLRNVHSLGWFLWPWFYLLVMQLVPKVITKLPYKKLQYPTYVKDALMLIVEYLKRPLKLMVKLCRLTLSTCLVSLLKIVTLNGVRILFKIIQIAHLKNWNKHFVNGSKQWKMTKRFTCITFNNKLLNMWRFIMNTCWN